MYRSFSLLHLRLRQKITNGHAQYQSFKDEIATVCVGSRSIGMAIKLRRGRN